MIYHYLLSFLRNVKKNKFFYSINLIGFFVGFLLLTIISAFVYQEFSFDRFHKNYSNIYRVNSGEYGVTPLCFKEELENKLPTISHVVQLSGTSLEIKNDNKKFNIDKVYYTDSDVFTVFSFKLILGNQNNALNKPFSIVLDQSIARALFGEQSALGKIIHGENGDYTVTGIMEDIPYNSHIQSKAFISLETLRQTERDNAFDCSNWASLTYVCLLKNTSTRDTETKINSILKDSRMANMPLKLEPLKKVYFDRENNKFDGCKHGNQQTTILYWAIGTLILLIVIFNYINLSITLLTNRLKEFSIRQINGAENKDIIQHILIEAIGVAFVSLIFALVLTDFLIHPLSNILNIPVSSSLKKSTLYTCCIISIGLISILIGLVPGIFISKINEIKALKNESIFGDRNTKRKLFLLLQLTIVAILLNSAFVVRKQISFMLQQDTGLQYENVIAFKMDSTLQNKSGLLKDKLLKNSCIKNISFSNALIGEVFKKIRIDINNRNELWYAYSIDPEYIGLYDIKLKYGRNFSSDLQTDGDNCIINEEAAKSFGIENPVDKMLDHQRIIGVVKNFNYLSLHNVIEPLIFTYRKGNFVQINIAPDNQKRTIMLIKKTCNSISANFNFNYTFMDSQIKDLYRSDMNFKISIEIYSIIALFIALLGLLGLLLFTIKKKKKEVSIRILHGATIGNIFRLFSKEQLLIVFISNIIALPISIFIINKWLHNFPYRVDIGFIVFFKTLFIMTVIVILVLSFLIIKTQNSNRIETLKDE